MTTMIRVLLPLSVCEWMLDQGIPEEIRYSEGEGGFNPEETYDAEDVGQFNQEHTERIADFKCARQNIEIAVSVDDSDDL